MKAICFPLLAIRKARVGTGFCPVQARQSPASTYSMTANLRITGLGPTLPVVEESFRFAGHPRAISNTSGWWLSVRGSSKQQQIPIRIFDDEFLGAPRLLFQSLVKGNASGLKLKKQ